MASNKKVRLNVKVKGYRTIRDAETNEVLGYRCRYFYYDSEKQKLRESESGTFKTKGLALADAERLCVLKEEGKSGTRRDKEDKTIGEAFQEYINDYEKRSQRKTTENTSSDIAIYHKAKTVKERYMPESIRDTLIKNIKPILFRDWIEYIDRNFDLSGSYIRNLKHILSSFNTWLNDEAYYKDRGLRDEIRYTLSQTKIKDSKVKNRELAGKRNVLMINDIQKVCNHFFKAGIGEFKNFYFYTLYYVMFFSGMRVEEIVGLQWKRILLNGKGKRNSVIKITSAINARDSRENVMYRLSQDVGLTKNTSSNRTIPILGAYYDLLVDYKESYRYEYDLTKEEIEECFVFPMLTKHNPRIYANADYFPKKLQEVLKAEGLPHSDCQMLRHSCATFLIMAEPEGMGYREDQVMKYFGHVDTDMLKQIYARLNDEQANLKLYHTFAEKGLIEEVEDETEAKRIEERNKLIANARNNDERRYKARKFRIYQQIECIKKKGQIEYRYNPKDKDIIEDYKSECEAFIEKNVMKNDIIEYYDEEKKKMMKKSVPKWHKVRYDIKFIEEE